MVDPLHQIFEKLITVPAPRVSRIILKDPKYRANDFDWAKCDNINQNISGVSANNVVLSNQLIHFYDMTGKKSKYRIVRLGYNEICS